MGNLYSKIFITGASSGIGRQLALDYAREGAELWLLARSELKLAELSREIQTLGGQAHILVCDATDEPSFLTALATAQEESTGFDLVIANAGWGGRMQYPGDKNIEVLNQVIDLNFRAATQTLEYYAKFMVMAKQGHLVGVSSIAGFRGAPGGAAYSATKAALISYLESLRFSVSPFGVFVTDIRPGFVRTPMTAKNVVPMPFLMDVERASQKIRRAISRKRKRFAFPWQMAVLLHLIKAAPDFLYDWVAALTFGKEAVTGRLGKSDSNTPT
ncbi:MAG: SDR family NAD(P)-dependent oxidoreductase [Candidatus Marinimicrobia bacterium]|nr:SDR family NAD(P)-dependent oxidoreductase [Candidatus Neomarinimicrobiota bacterium]MCF7921114.1 SDR family NAD(P)-dependent oxidoreductase [Candidatus Neomarinimicrobiota bacterium]